MKFYNDRIVQKKNQLHLNNEEMNSLTQAALRESTDLINEGILDADLP